jgi:hypothetical protein
MSLLSLKRRVARIESARQEALGSECEDCFPPLNRQERADRIRFLLDKCLRSKQLEHTFENHLTAVNEVFHRRGQSAPSYARQIVSSLYP